MSFNYISQIMIFGLFLHLTFSLGITCRRFGLIISESDLIYPLIVFGDITYLARTVSSDEVSFKSSDLVFVFTEERRRHIFNASVQPKLLYDYVNLVAVNLSSLAIFHHQLLFAVIFKRP